MTLFEDYPPREKLLPLSYGIELSILSRLTDTPPDTEEALYLIVSECYQLVYSKEEVVDNITTLVSAVVSRIKELKEVEESHGNSASFPHSKSLGTSYSEWLSKLDPTESCLYLCDFDTVKALNLFWREDVRIIQQALSLKGNKDSQIMLANMEACMYGFGGKYEEDSGGQGIQLGTKEASDALNSLGF